MLFCPRKLKWPLALGIPKVKRAGLPKSHFQKEDTNAPSSAFCVFPSAITQMVDGGLHTHIQSLRASTECRSSPIFPNRGSEYHDRWTSRRQGTTGEWPFQILAKSIPPRLSKQTSFDFPQVLARSPFLSGRTRRAPLRTEVRAVPKPSARPTDGRNLLAEELDQSPCAGVVGIST